MPTVIYRGPRTRVDYPTALRIPIEKGEDVLLAQGVPQEVDDEIAERAQAVTGERVDVLPAEADPDPAAGTIEEVLDRVGDDPDQAREALEAERAKQSPRSTLVEQLEARATEG